VMPHRGEALGALAIGGLVRDRLGFRDSSVWYFDTFFRRQDDGAVPGMLP
jgi:hypothetical protein